MSSMSINSATSACSVSSSGTTIPNLEEQFWKDFHGGGCYTDNIAVRKDIPKERQLYTLQRVIDYMVNGKSNAGRFLPVDPSSGDFARDTNGWRLFRKEGHTSGKTIMLKSIIKNVNLLEEIRGVFELKFQPTAKGSAVPKTSIWQGEEPEPISRLKGGNLEEGVYDERNDGVLDRVVIVKVTRDELNDSQKDLLRLLDTFVTEYLNKYAGLASGEGKVKRS